MTRRFFLACLVAGLVVSTTMYPAAARRGGRSDRDDDDDRRRRDRNEHRDSHREDDGSLDAAVARVKRETGGRVLSAEKRGRRGDSTYRIKVLLPNGSVRFFDVAPRNEKD